MKIPTPDSETGLLALKAMIDERHPLAAMSVFHRRLGDVFRIHLPGFTPVVMAGPQAARFVLVQAVDDLRWRNENDPVTRLLRHGVLVEDGPSHDALRRSMTPALHKGMLEGYVSEMFAAAHQVWDAWPEGGVVDMLVEMRKVALLALMRTLYRVDFSPELRRLWGAVLSDIRYISPGLWMIWRGAPRPGYARAIKRLDAYLYQIIAARRQQQVGGKDLLGLLIDAEYDDDAIRDQLLTMLIAGHDTVTALMAWSLALLGQHQWAMDCAVEEARQALPFDRAPDLEQLNRLSYLGDVIKESLRLYPPIHLGSRLAAQDIPYEDFIIPAGERVIYSIYLTQRREQDWPEPERFDPLRHRQARPAPYTWLAFGGGARNCIGAAYGQMEAKVVLAAILRRFDLTLLPKKITPYMGATLEPHPGVMMRVRRVKS